MSLFSNQAIIASKTVPTIAEFRIDGYGGGDDSNLGGTDTVTLPNYAYRLFSGNNLIGNLITSSDLQKSNKNVIVSVPDFTQFYQFKFRIFNDGTSSYNTINFIFQEEKYIRNSETDLHIAYRQTGSKSITVGTNNTIEVHGYWEPNDNKTSATLTLYYYNCFYYDAKIISITPTVYSFGNIATQTGSFVFPEDTANDSETSEVTSEVTSEETYSSEETYEITYSSEETSYL